MDKHDFYDRPYSERTGCGGPLLLAVACLSLLCLWMGWQFWQEYGSADTVRSDTVTIVRVDTLWRTDSVPKLAGQKTVMPGTERRKLTSRMP